MDRNGIADLKGLSNAAIGDFKVVTKDGLEFVVYKAINGDFAFNFPDTGIVRGRIKNFAESKLPQILLNSRSFEGWESSRKCAVGANGEFTAHGMVPGQVSVYGSWDPKDLWQPEPFEYPTVVANAITDFEISLVRGTPLSGQLLTDDSREPIKSAKMLLQCSYQFGTTGASYALETDDEGRFSACLAPGEWTLQVYDIGSWGKSYVYPPFEKFSVQPEESKVDLGVIEIPAMRTETGEVVDKEGNPVAHRWIAYITPELGHATRSAKTDASGKFTAKVFRVLHPGSIPFWVIYPDGETTGKVDARTLETLRVEGKNPWRLLLEK